MSVVRMYKARMVSPTVLGIDAEVGFFHEEPQEGPRYVKLKATINGQPVEEKIPVTDLVSPGKIVLLEWPRQDRLKIDLKKWGIDRFTKDQVFTLTATAFCLASGPGRESTVEVRIPLPVIIVHGYILKEWWEKDSYLEPYYKLQEFLKRNGYDDSESGYRTMWGQPDIRFSPQDATAEDIARQADNWINDALKNTYAAKVNIIGVSLGGLVGRYYITEYNASKVYKLLLVTVVNEGSSLFEGEFFIKLASSKAEAQAFLLNLEGKENLANWLFPTYQSLYTLDGKEVPHPFKNLFHEKGYDKPAPPGLYYYSIFSAQRESPYELYVEEVGDWYRLIGDKRKGTGDGNSIVQTYKTFGCNILVPTNTHHAFMLGDSKVQSTILNVLRCKPEEYCELK
ncbi:MAG: hypothetical protein COW04_04550 [Deltaproteobacteria bacterium CG12_big_fil_rev_8_21_14_0_65_43_10]|nr:MAG: hypothetical protein COW04_04550 [Deltaproteobacteria bacterium CG12_big_fil_rev_8_21_14_0_65_43_10]PIU85916.1 MAG: hypothetical protein COS67_05360 [Deltaproteobacteria bacterium CG06_land_8_20_14_3_00_44_19]PIX24185.1 MAG: hypothetical protein COZ68_07110 [Deltaproteobacteria bacterium CG_4_8_14_3_um_filter_43_13]PIZ19211.1 MAG: hypothetical protein COY50_11290 [Deltaproteobacteria bacterium CG_4_10_14_0_8_um_filter_43_12]PJB39638.1 MAG: hypothetical protein CO106_10720 [Deltaproteoba